jgi:diguanylate cyclase (GGDEF)-like protein
VSLVDWMLPRDHRAAARSVSTLCAVGAGVSVVFAPFQPAERQAGTSALLIGGGVILLVTLLAVLARHFHEANRIAWTVSPLLAVAAIAVVDLLTNDSSVSAQIFFVFPTLYGASQLRIPGAIVMTVASIVGEVIVVRWQLSTRDALVDAGYVTAALVTTAVLLTVTSERQARLVARLEQMAAVDPLTGLVTRRVLDEAANSALSGAASDEGTSLILLDVDEFKTINDAHGHPAGDAVLVALAERITERTRREDVVCRLGGDEIAVLLPACSRAVARQRAEDLLADVRARTFAIESEHGGRHDLTVGISVGLAHAPSDADDLRSLYAAADAALYEAKRAGRGRMADAADLTRAQTRRQTGGQTTRDATDGASDSDASVS